MVFSPKYREGYHKGYTNGYSDACKDMNAMMIFVSEYQKEHPEETDNSAIIQQFIMKKSRIRQRYKPQK